MSQKPKAYSPEGVIGSPQGGKITDLQGYKAKLKATLEMKAVSSEVDTKEAKFMEETFGGSHHIYPNHPSEIVSTLYSDKNQTSNDIIVGILYNNFIIYPVINCT